MAAILTGQADLLSMCLFHMGQLSYFEKRKLYLCSLGSEALHLNSLTSFLWKIPHSLCLLPIIIFISPANLTVYVILRDSLRKIFEQDLDIFYLLRAPLFYRECWRHCWKVRQRLPFSPLTSLPCFLHKNIQLLALCVNTQVGDYTPQPQKFSTLSLDHICQYPFLWDILKAVYPWPLFILFSS